MQRSNKNTDAILNSLDGISRAEARPFMHTRVMARLQEENSFWGRAVGFISRPIIALACISLVLIANAYTVISSELGEQQEEVSTVASSTVSDVLQNNNYILAINDAN